MSRPIPYSRTNHVTVIIKYNVGLKYSFYNITIIYKHCNA